MTRLAVDAMYLSAARQALSRAEKATKRINKAELKVRSLQFQIDGLCGHDEIFQPENYEKLERLSIGMEDAEYGVGDSYGPYLQDLATVHILCAASAEAHINIRGKDLLEGRIWDTFERLSLDGKWLVLPRLIGLSGFMAGAEPFQSFDRLIKWRNNLVHF